MSTWSTCLPLYCLRSFWIIKRLSFTSASSPRRSYRSGGPVIAWGSQRFMLAYHSCVVPNGGPRRFMVSWYSWAANVFKGFLSYGETTAGCRPWPKSIRWRLNIRCNAGMLHTADTPQIPIKSTCKRNRANTDDHTHNGYVWILITPQVTTSRHLSAYRRSSGTQAEQGANPKNPSI